MQLASSLARELKNYIDRIRLFDLPFEKTVMSHKSFYTNFILIILSTITAFSQTAPTHKDIVYATVDGKQLTLDLYIPSKPVADGLLVWVHGGAWRRGTKDGVPKVFPERGIPTASIEFRQLTEARFPAQVHDIKAAIRFLRAKASTFGCTVDRIVIAGSSSGGHLAALVGVTNGNAELEGKVGDYLSAILRGSGHRGLLWRL